MLHLNDGQNKHSAEQGSPENAVLPPLRIALCGLATTLQRFQLLSPLQPFFTAPDRLPVARGVAVAEPAPSVASFPSFQGFFSLYPPQSDHKSRPGG